MAELGEVCDVRDGTHDSPKYVPEGYPLITSKKLKDGFIDFTGVNLISREDLDAVNKRSKVDAGDLLMPMIGTIGNGRPLHVLLTLEGGHQPRPGVLVRRPASTSRSSNTHSRPPGGPYLPSTDGLASDPQRRPLARLASGFSRSASDRCLSGVILRP
jgi:hypothetical protein